MLKFIRPKEINQSAVVTGSKQNLKPAGISGKKRGNI
jgi:hypothetical protein